MKSVVNLSWHCGEKALAFPAAHSLAAPLSLSPSLLLRAYLPLSRLAHWHFRRRMRAQSQHIRPRRMCTCTTAAATGRYGNGNENERTPRPRRATYDARLRGSQREPSGSGWRERVNAACRRRRRRATNTPISDDQRAKPPRRVPHRRINGSERARASHRRRSSTGSHAPSRFHRKLSYPHPLRSPHSPAARVKGVDRWGRESSPSSFRSLWVTYKRDSISFFASVTLLFPQRPLKNSIYILVVAIFTSNVLLFSFFLSRVIRRDEFWSQFARYQCIISLSNFSLVSIVCNRRRSNRFHFDL